MDVEHGATLPDGYPTLATWIARDPDSDTFVFRKFSRLGARNILHLQAELTALQHEIDEDDDEARCSQDFKTKQGSRRWETLTERAAKSPDGLEARRVEKMNKLRVLLKEYCMRTQLQKWLMVCPHRNILTKTRRDPPTLLPNNISFAPKTSSPRRQPCPRKRHIPPKQ